MEENMERREERVEEKIEKMEDKMEKRMEKMEGTLEAGFKEMKKDIFVLQILVAVLFIVTTVA